MADMLPPAVQKFIADTKEYNEPLNRSADQTTKFGKAAEEASIVAKRAMENAAEAARRLSLAEEEVVRSAKKAKDGLISEAESAEVAARATKAKVKADLASRESALASANAADKQAAQFRQVARDAALMEAAEFLAQTRAAGATKKNRDEIAQLAKLFPELKQEAESALQSIGAGSKQAASQIGFMKIGVGAVIQQLPFLASAAAGAITVVMGGAFSALGLKMQASSASAKNTINDFKKNASSAMKELTVPFQATWENMDIAAHKAFDDIEPSLANMFMHLSTSTSLFVRRTGEAFYKLGPMFDALGLAYQRVMDDLGGKMPEILNNIQTGFTAMFDAVTAHPEAFTDLVVGTSQVVRGLGDLMGWLIKIREEFGFFWKAVDQATGLGTIKQLFGWIGKNSKANKDLSESQLANARAAQKSKLDSDRLVSSLEAQRITVDQLKQAFDRFTGANQSAATAEINAQQAIDDTTASIKANGRTIDTNTQKGRDNYKQLIATAKAFQDEAVAAKNDGASQKQLDGLMGSLRGTFYRLALQMTGNKAEARKLTDSLLGIAAASKKIPRSIHQDIYQVMHLTASQAYLNKRANFNLKASGGPIRGFAGGGDVPGFADGGPSGWVDAPGTETSDSGTIRVSKNEFVVRAEQAKKHQALLMEINSGVTSWAKTGKKPPPVPMPWKNAKEANFTANKSLDWAASHAAASMIGAFRRSSESAWMTRGGVGSGHGVVVQHITNVTVQGSLLSERMLNDQIQSSTLQRNIRNPTSGVNLQSGRIGG